MRSNLESLESRRLLSVNLLADFGGFYPTDSVEIGSTSYFAANDGVYGKELWKSDGTQSGTTIVKDLLAGATGSEPTELTIFGSKFIFFAKDSDGSSSLWISDGTSAGTKRLADLPTGVEVNDIAVVNGVAVFPVMNDNTLKVELWTSNGTAQGTHFAKHLYNFEIQGPGQRTAGLPHLIPIAGRVLIQDTGVHLWSTDGTAAGTIELGDDTGTDLSRPWGVVWAAKPYQGKALLKASRAYPDGHDMEIWVTDGTNAGTQRIATIPKAGGTDMFAPLGDRLLFTARVLINDDPDHPEYEEQLWVTDGTVAGTSFVKTMPDTVYFNAPISSQRTVLLVHGSGGIELWSSDGTADGTFQVKALTADTDNARDFISVGGMNYFMIYRDTNTDNEQTYLRQLWRTDGTTEGTVMVEDLTSVSEYDPMFESSTLVDGKIVIQTPQRTVIYDPAGNAPAAQVVQQAALLKDGILRVYGTSGDDLIRIYRKAGDESRLIVNINGVKRQFRVGDVTKMLVYGYAGNDDIGISDSRGKAVLRSRIWGGAGNDVILTSAARDSVYGDAGDDTILSGKNDDLVSGGYGDDSITAGAGNDTASGDNGADHLAGEAGNDVIAGGDDDGEDWLYGGSGEDVVFGSAVYDTFYKPSGDPGSLVDDLLTT